MQGLRPRGLMQNRRLILFRRRRGKAFERAGKIHEPEVGVTIQGQSHRAVAGRLLELLWSGSPGQSYPLSSWLTRWREGPCSSPPSRARHDPHRKLSEKATRLGWLRTSVPAPPG